MKKLLVYLENYKKECVLGPLFKLLEATFELLVPLIVASIVDVGIASGDKIYIYKMTAIMIAFCLVGLISSVTAQYFAAKTAVGFSSSLRHSLIKHINTFSFKEIDTLGTSSLITKLTSDVNQLQNGVNLCLRLLLRSPFVVFGAMIMAFTIDIKSALVFVVVIPVLCVVVFGIMLWTIPKYTAIQRKLDGITKATRENFNGVRIIRAFRQEKTETCDFKQNNNSLALMQMVVGKISALMNPITFVIINFAIIVLIWVGAVRVYSGNLTQGQVIALYNYMSQILIELIKMANLVITMTKAAACGKRVVNVLETTSSQNDGTEELTESIKQLSFKNVSLNYHKNSDPALANISFTAKKGQLVGIIGGTGSGKSTLINLIPRFYDCTKGEILINQSKSQNLKLSSLRSKISIVPQKAVLFSGTVRSNLLWGNQNATDQNLIEALKIAQAYNFLAEKQGLDTVVEQSGKNFSGGQRQRLTIARALVKKPEILILDDSSSALDFATESMLRKEIGSLQNSPIIFVVSQRIASIKTADFIIVLDKGSAVGCGTHSDLLENCDVYSEIYYSQFPKSEVQSND